MLHIPPEARGEKLKGLQPQFFHIFCWVLWQDITWFGGSDRPYSRGILNPNSSKRAWSESKHQFWCWARKMTHCKLSLDSTASFHHFEAQVANFNDLLRLQEGSTSKCFKSGFSLFAEQLRQALKSRSRSFHWLFDFATTKPRNTTTTSLLFLIPGTTRFLKFPSWVPSL